MKQTFEKLGFLPADILLPAHCDMTKWSVVACDQYTSEPEYWQRAEQTVGTAPSALRLILPEYRLEAGAVQEDIAAINAAMENYLDSGVWELLSDSFIYVERTQKNGAVRHGLVGVIDLDCYDYRPGAGSLIRATEGTVLSRIPPRLAVRQNAPVELTHVMLLVDDPEDTVFAPVFAQKEKLGKLYDFELMENGGGIRGFAVNGAAAGRVADALDALAEPKRFNEKYGVSDKPVLLFAVGDGNHSLATAKESYQQRKRSTPESEWANMPSRYALVELVNLHDPALVFEPIHRVVFETEPEKLLKALFAYYPHARCDGVGEQRVDYIYAGDRGTIAFEHPQSGLTVGTLQNFLDAYVAEHGGRIDYIHGDDVAETLGSQPGNIGFKLAAMEKFQLFKTVITDGVLPRKTFSMGQAHDKRYYLEGRKIR